MSEFPTLTGYYELLFLYLEPRKQKYSEVRVVLTELQSLQCTPRFMSLSIQAPRHFTMT